MKKLFPILVSGCCFMWGCKKEPAITNTFAAGLHDLNVTQVTNQVQGLLKLYSESNLNSFAASLASKYDVNATVLCFDCIQTNPAETELRILYNFQGAQETRILDMSRDHSNIMKLVSIHE